MRCIRVLIMAMGLGLSVSLFAHGSGHATITVEQAKEVARDVVVKLSEEDRGMGFGRLDESWNMIPGEKVAISGSGSGYYIVVMEHEAEDRKIYVLMSNAGSVYDVNFTGKFKGIE